MPGEILMTTEGYNELKKELETLRTVKRKEIAEKIRVARGFGDLSENSEYDEAKNEQAIVEAKIATLEEQLKKARLISKEQISTDVVSVGTTVTILDVEFDEEMSYRIASSVESNHSSMETITDESPVGRALLGHSVGDEVEVVVPSGSMVRFKVVDISL
ncbi:MAG: transcription elongation factor GreA [Oscillospiraceae bacterium]|jgi:transcription elongation factor GreA|nr:transcription elongation factor GreA [Oscillospiraceae bacterium]